MYQAYVQRACEPSLLPLRIREMGWHLPFKAPFLVSQVTGAPIPEVLHYLREECFSRSRRQQLNASPRTLEARAYDLKDIYDYFDAIAKRVEEASLEDLRAYIDGMCLQCSPVTHRRYADKTIKRRADTLRSFFSYLQDNGLSKTKFGVGPLRPERRSSYNTDKFANDLWEPDGIDEDMQVVAIEPDELARILAAIGPLRAYGEGLTPVLASPTERRDRLACETGFQTGLRREEIANLRADRVRAARPTLDKPHRLHGVRVFRKGGRWSTVLFPGWLLLELLAYLDRDRSAAVNLRHANDPAFVDHGFVFVRHSGAKKYIADALDRKHFNRVFSSAQTKLGITKRLIGRNEDATTIQVVAKYGFHSLRHSYAVYTYFARREMGDQEPWKFLQLQLDHKDVGTTIRIYLRITHELESLASDMLEEIVREKIRYA